jgi:hypothetical protein
MRILSIDIGAKNCAFYVEQFDEKKITSSTLYIEGKRIYWDKADFTRGNDLYVNIGLYLDSHRKIWDECNGIIIERQLETNPKAQSIQFMIFGYFKNLYGPFKYISDISATRKTQVLGAPKKMTKKQRKDWAVLKTHTILDSREDMEGLKILYQGKGDDLADACVQLKAFQKLVFIDGKQP